MSLEIDNINVGGTLSATTVSATTIVMGSQTLQQIFAPSTPGGYLPISGGTVTGETIFIAGLSANTLSGGTLYGDGSNLTGVGNVVSASLTWKFSTTTSSADPGSGNFRYNNATPLNVSEIYVDYITENGIDTKTLLNRIKSGAQIYIQQRDSSAKATLFNVTGDSVDNTGWFTIPVTAVSDAGGGVPQNNKGCIFLAILNVPTGETGTSTYVQPGTNITTGGTAQAPIINLIASPSVNNITFSGTAIGGTVQAGSGTFTSLSAATISGGTLYSGSTNLYDIFSTGGPGGTSTYVQPGTNIITGGTATSPIVNLIDSPSVNNITFSGTAIGGTVQAGAGTFTSLSAATLSGGTIFSGNTNLYSIFATIPDQNDVTRVQPGSNITTGGTANLPTVNLVASPSVNNLTISGLTSSSDGATFSSLSGTNIFSGSTNLQTYFDLDRAQINTKANLSGATFTGGISSTALSGTNIFSGSTNLQTYFDLDRAQINTKANLSGATFTGGISSTALSGTNIFSGSTNLQTYFNTINAQLATKANDSGDTFTGQVNIPTLSATTLSANTSVFISSIKYPVSPVAGYMLTSDASGNATWQANPTSGSGTTKLDMQSISTANTISVTTTLVDLVTLTAKNLGSSATTYQIFYNANFNNNNAAGNTTLRVIVNSTEIINARTIYTNSTTQMASFRRNASSIAFITGVTNGDTIKIQMSAQTGTASVSGRTLSIIGTLTTNLV